MASDQVVEEVGNGVVGFSALTEEPLFLGPKDQRLLFCRRPVGMEQLENALVLRITDRKGMVRAAHACLVGKEVWKQRICQVGNDLGPADRWTVLLVNR
jgi:hypothetical protein